MRQFNYLFVWFPVDKAYTAVHEKLLTAVCTKTKVHTKPVFVCTNTATILCVCICTKENKWKQPTKVLPKEICRSFHDTICTDVIGSYPLFVKFSFQSVFGFCHLMDNLNVSACRDILDNVTRHFGQYSETFWTMLCFCGNTLQKALFYSNMAELQSTVNDTIWWVLHVRTWKAHTELLIEHLWDELDQRLWARLRLQLSVFKPGFKTFISLKRCREVDILQHSKSL